MVEWFEDETFWRDLEPFLFSETRLAAGEGEVDDLLRLIGFHGETVLDLCCGPGRHAIALARRGLRVTAVDRSPHLLERARSRAAKAQVEIERVEADMREFERLAAFDLAVNLYSSIGYFGSQEADREVLRRVRRSLRPDGVLVMELMGREVLAGKFQPDRSTRLDDGSLLVERRSVHDAWTRVHNEWILLRGDEVKRFEFDLALYAGTELQDIMCDAGFASVQLFGDFEGHEYGPEARRLVAVARCSETAPKAQEETDP